MYIREKTLEIVLKFQNNQFYNAKGQY